MFNTFSWTEFLTLIFFLAATYYVIAALLFFRHEIIARLSSKPTVRENKNNPSRVEDFGSEIIGNVQSAPFALGDKRLSLGTADEIMIDNSDEAPETLEAVTPKSGDMIIGTIPDLLEEIKTVIDQISSMDQSTSELTTLFEALLGRYAQLRNTPYQETISVFIHELGKEKLKTELSLQQIRACWN